jgi:hypothetical protein
LFIPDPDPNFLLFPDPGVKRAPDPGSGSATLVNGKLDLSIRQPSGLLIFCLWLVDLRRWMVLLTEKEVNVGEAIQESLLSSLKGTDRQFNRFGPEA